MPREMTKSPKRNNGDGNSHLHSPKRQRLASVSTDDDSNASNASNASSSGEENEETLMVLSDDSDSEEERTLGDFLRSSKHRRFSSPKSVTVPNSNVLDCPTCFEPLKKPIFQCNNGHLACFVCCIKLKKKCSFCKSSIGDIRCRAMEKVIKESLVSCSNAMYGCEQSTTYGIKSSNHEKVCVFSPCSCPILDCNYIGFYKDLNNHFRVAHERKAALVMPFVLNRSIIFGLDLSDDVMVIFQEEKEGDVVVVQGFIGSHGVYVTVSHIAPMVPEVRKFSCSLAKLKEYSTLRLGLRVKNIQKLIAQEEAPENDYLLIPSYMLSGDHLKMQICIGNEDDYIHI